jgi:hypothetical protein
MSPAERERLTRRYTQEILLVIGPQVDILAPLSAEEQAWVLANTAMITCEQGRVRVRDADDGSEVTYGGGDNGVDLCRHSYSPSSRWLTGVPAMSTRMKRWFAGQSERSDSLAIYGSRTARS